MRSIPTGGIKPEGSNCGSVVGAKQAPSVSAPDSGFSSAAPSIIDYEFDYPSNMSFQNENSSMSSHNVTNFHDPPQPTPESMSPVSFHAMDTSPKPHSSEMASSYIPTLIELLADDEYDVQIKASNVILQLSQEKGSRTIISDTPEMIAALLDALSKTNNMEVIENVVGVLHNLSEYRQGRQSIYTFGGITELVRMLSCNSESIIHLAITALHLLLLHQEGSKEAVRSAQGLPMLISLLSNSNEEFLSIVIDCIRLLAYGDSETKRFIHHLGGTMELVRILQNCTYSNLLWVTCSTLKVLSACSENKRAIIENGGLQAIAMHLDTKIDQNVSNCLFIVRNLSDAAVNQEGLHILLANVMNILRFTLNDNPPTKHESTITCVAGILSNLTCRNQTNKQIVRQLGGVEILIETIEKLWSNEKIIEPTVCALRHLTCRYSEAELAAHAIRNCQGLLPIINLLNSCNWALKKAVVGLLRNLALCEANIAPLREHFAIQKLAGVLAEAHVASRTNDMSTGEVPMDAPFITDPKIEAIIEEAETTLGIMAKDPASKEMIRETLAFTAPTTDLTCDMTFNGFAC